MAERVVITGMGAVSPLGLTVERTWDRLVNGVSGVGPITLFDPSDYPVQIACEVKDFVPEEHMPARDARRRDRFEQFASVASTEALAQAGLEGYPGDPRRIGVIVSSAIGGIHTIQESTYQLRDEGPRRLSPFAIPMMMANGAAGLIAIDHEFQGPCFSVSSACASGADGIGVAWCLLRAGVIDVAVSGASEATITQIGIGAFDRLGAMSRRTLQDLRLSPSAGAPKPFDKERDGLVMGEGAAILILETESHARQRGAEILAELAGYAATADAFHITAPSEDGAGSAQAMSQALRAAGIPPDQIDYINAHGTATPLNDLSETRAIKTSLGQIAYNIPVSSTKSMTGHMMGATGALEAIFCVQAIHHGVIPPTINYHTPDPECDLDYVPNQARQKRVRVAMSNAFGFGGHNAVLVLREYN
ncbi:MAG: beta-ketoacyl-ACP synthase II [Anaerolineales bacterium]|nr:beta-ketoacyl-ACP synthase II [Anaerolineales bacterium]